MLKKVIILSGLSGSGNTTVIKELIDLNYFVLTYLKSKNYYELLKNIVNNSDNDKIAIFLNISEDYDEMYDDILKLKEEMPDVEYIQLYLRATSEVLINRFQENRKVHPYIKNFDKNVNVEKAISIEKQISKRFSKESDYIIDTTSILPNELIKILKSDINENSKCSINLFSFGFKYGLYQYSDYVFDVRFLNNPYYVEELRSKSGEDVEVYDYVFSDPDANKFLEYIIDMILLVTPRFQEVDKDSISVSIGCTGGKHRSVAFVEEISKRLEAVIGEKYEINKIHLEKEKGKWND